MAIRSFGFLVLIVAAALVADLSDARSLNDATEGTAANRLLLGHSPNRMLTDDPVIYPQIRFPFPKPNIPIFRPKPPSRFPPLKRTPFPKPPPPPPRRPRFH
uniref:Uncharacterized protein n=1 Tax=Kalanchoe fedtschenkoi TaxID=63787 RepID=A0A7N0T0K2_KALFE